MKNSIKVETTTGIKKEGGWSPTQWEPTAWFLKENGMTGAENTIWEKGEHYAVGTVNTWGRQEGVARVFHCSKMP